MNAGGVLVYKCRRCGELNKNTHTPHCLMSLTLITGGIPQPKEWGAIVPKIVSFHVCDDKNLGVTDLIGAEMDEAD